MIRVLQIIDSLNTGGAERVAVNYANGLATMTDGSYLCVTREEGPLFESVNTDVSYIFLNKKSTLDFKAIFKLRKYIIKNKINIIHAHSSSFFIAVLIKWSLPKVKIVWHDHYGNSDFVSERPLNALRFCSHFFSIIISVNSTLKDWAVDNLNGKKVLCVKNFPVLKKINSNNTVLHGVNGKRILCLANLREQKNHLRLLEAMELVKNEYPDWTLHCVGKDFKDDYSQDFFLSVNTLNLTEHVFFYDSRFDILNIMEQCSIGILVSKSEGLPLALLEYGLSGLPVIATNVGDCGLLVPNSTYGILLENDNKNIIAASIIKYIENKGYMYLVSENFNDKIKEEYSSAAILHNTLNEYKTISRKS